MFAALTERTSEWALSRRRSGRLALDFINSSLSSSMGALVFTVPLAAAHFGMISVVSLLTNLLCLWAVSALFIGGWRRLSVFAVFARSKSWPGVCPAGPRPVFAVLFSWRASPMRG
jgi:hypothetical protein